jgi:hypothetical protein
MFVSWLCLLDVLTNALSSSHDPIAHFLLRSTLLSPGLDYLSFFLLLNFSQFWFYTILICSHSWVAPSFFFPDVFDALSFFLSFFLSFSLSLFL